MLNLDSLDASEEFTLNLAAFKSETRALGPGLRSAVWVQGCPFSCPGCIAPEWIPQRSANQVSTRQLADMILNCAEVTGITLSGGEPMQQAAALADLVRRVRAQREVDVICFTGFFLADLVVNDAGPGVSSLLAEIDVLVDGPYIAALNDERGLRGSSNQRFHYLTSRLKDIPFETMPRKVEITIQEGNMLLAGIPTRKNLEAIDGAIKALRAVGH